MQVKGISNSPMFIQPNKNTKVDETSKKPKDTIEISSEARDLAKLELSPERLEEIRSKIASGFYETDEVLSKVVDKLSADVLK